MGVSRVINLARSLDGGECLGPKEKVLSSNIVAGVSLNLPIYKTCKPTKVCAENCYAGRNTPIAMKVAVSKQVRILNSIIANPLEVGGRIVKELRGKIKRGLKFLRWNGVGDLNGPSIECLIYVADQLPEFPIWVVTRLPDMALKVPHRDNVFIQFSLDRDSERRYRKMSGSSALSQNLFYSYTESNDEGELPDWLLSAPISVYYTDLYKSSAPYALQKVSCPLNGSEDVKDACENCGRCWDGSAVKIKGERKPIAHRVFSSKDSPSLFDL
jgi:hypothetical protein